jgi:Skp family chaperone for outer membrane proteins
VREALTQAAGQIEAQLRPAMEAQIQKAKESIAQSIAAERSDIERTLTAKRQALQQGESEAAAQREKAQTDLNQLQAWLAALPVESKA